MESPRNTRKRTVRFLTEEIDNAAACLSASRTVICQEVGLRHEHWKALEVIGRSPLTLSISWLLMTAFDLGERELRHLANTLRAVRGRIARARDYAGGA